MKSFLPVLTIGWVIAFAGSFINLATTTSASVDAIDAELPARLASKLAPESTYFVVDAKDDVVFRSGSLLVRVDDRSMTPFEDVDHVMAPGVYWNLGRDVAIVQTLDGSTLRLEPRQMIAVGVAGADPPGGSYGVRCGPGFYACCQKPDKAFCVPSNQAPPGACDTGGTGAVECFLPGDAPPDPDDLEPDGAPAFWPVIRRTDTDIGADG